MRSGTVDGLNANHTGVSNRCVTIELLTGETILIPIEGKTACSAIWNRVEGELVARGVVHPQIFGLAIKTGSDWVFVDPDAKLSKYCPKDGKFTTAQSSHPGSLNNDGKQPIVFYCRVHFYLDALPHNFDVVSLHHYYLQLRQNLVSAPRFPPASVVQSVAYAFQSELGDWRPGHQDLPRWVQSQPLISSIGPSLSRAHQALSGLGQQAARLAFIRAVMPQYNMHLFGMTLKTKEGKDAPAWIGVTPKGIEVYQNAVGCNEIPEQPKLTFLWANITKLYFERKKFEIRGRAFPWANSIQKLSFTASSESVPRHLLLLCRSTHQFHLSNHKILLTTENLNSHKTSASSTGGESSCNSTLLSSSSKNDDKMLDLSLWADGLLLAGESSEHQRVSVISNASSNTTSGIVSDRVYSLDGSEAEDLELREIPDCCTDPAHHHHNSTSLESLTHNRHPPPPSRLHHLSRNHNSHGANVNVNRRAGVPAAEDEDAEAKYWYCDSDCEDCDDSGPCRSLLVRTIGGEKRGCAGHCQCNSCVADEDELDGLDIGDESASPNDRLNGHKHQHHNTPSMASETTLKAVDISSDVTLNESNSGVENNVRNAPATQNKDSVTMISELRSSGKGNAETVQKNNSDECGDGETGEIEEYKLEDEHVYGEISEDPEPKAPIKQQQKTELSKIEDQQYSTIDGEQDSMRKVKSPPKAKPRYSCIKSVEPQKSGCKCRSREKCCNPTKKNVGICKKVVTRQCNASTPCPKDCKKCFSTSNVITGKENGLTPKVASLKCLRKQKPSCSSNVRRNQSSRDKREFEELPPMNYVEFGEKLQQGRYPSTRTVSDNFDTDSDYVQLPPLAWYPPRPPPKRPGACKLWKLVSKTHKGQASPAPPPSPPLVNINTLPRRKSELSCVKKDICTSVNGCASSTVRSNFIQSKVSSRSTNALNLLAQEKPEPPPKPRKSLADLSTIGKKDDGGNAVDARFIATKPQILIQTAYATTAPVAIPSQAQVLLRGVKLSTPGGGNNSHHHTVQVNSTGPVLQHSQSVDNIYDTVASEEPFVPSITPPPYPTKTSVPLIIRPNNYIDVHASSVKNKTSTKPLNIPTTAATNHYLGGVKSIGNKCGSVPNNLNNFLIGLQNLKPLSRTPIVHPGATSCLALNQSMTANHHLKSNPTILNPCCVSHAQHCPGNATTTMTNSPMGPVTTTTACQGNPNSGPNARQFTTVYTNQLTRSQIQQFKAQLYSDLDYVIFPPKDPRVSQQEYFDSKSLSYTTVSSTNSNPLLTTSAYQINDLPPAYLPPPPPYPTTLGGPSALSSNIPPPLPRKNPKMPKPLPGATSTTSVTNVTPISAAMGASSSPYHHNSFQSLYHPGSNNSHCSSSQYGYYSAGLNSENLQRFLSTQSFAGSNASAPIYYPSSTQSAPPLPPYKQSGQVLIENGMRKAVQQLITSRTSAAAGMTATANSEERLRMKLCRSEESLYSQPAKETAEEKLQAIYNLPPPPPYKRTTNAPNPHPSRRQESLSSAELDLATLRARCHALELPLLRALCSETELLSKNMSTRDLILAAKNRIRPTAHAHPHPKLSLPPKRPVPPTPKSGPTSQPHKPTAAS